MRSYNYLLVLIVTLHDSVSPFDHTRNIRSITQIKKGFKKYITSPQLFTQEQDKDGFTFAEPSTTKIESQVNAKVWSDTRRRDIKQCILLLALTTVFVFTNASEALALGHPLSSDTLTNIKQIVDPESLRFEIMSGMSHFALELFELVTSEKFLIRLASIFGRILNLEIAEATPGASPQSSPEEILFQSIMLGVSLVLVRQHVMVLCLAMLGLGPDIGFREKAAYATLFRPVGISWLQFYTMLALKVIDWVDLEPNTNFSAFSCIDGKTKPEFFYCVYMGDILVSVNNATFLAYENSRRGRLSCHDFINGEGSGTRVSKLGSVRLIKNSTRPRMSADIPLIMDWSFSKTFERRAWNRSRRNSRFPLLNMTDGSHNEKEELTLSPDMRVSSGCKGASLLRIHARNLIQMMDEDEKLDMSMTTFLICGMNLKLSSIMKRKSN